MLYWYPKIKGIVPTPRTIFVPLPEDVEAWMDSGIPNDFVQRLRKENQFGYPVFMRTDQLAGKHSWIETCYVSKPEDMGGNCYRLIEENLMADFLGGMNPKAIVLREFLKLDADFKAFKGMPVAREFRVFTEDGKVICIHPYWPPESMQFEMTEADKSKVKKMPVEKRLAFQPSEPKGWREQLSRLSELPRGDELSGLKEAATICSKEVGGYWSVDLCRTANGRWYITDMAVGQRSFHWKGCSKAKKVAVLS